MNIKKLRMDRTNEDKIDDEEGKQANKSRSWDNTVYAIMEL